MTHHHGSQDVTNGLPPTAGDHVQSVFTVALEHEVALVSLLFLPVALLLALLTVHRLSRFVWFLRPLAHGIQAASPATLVAVLLMLATADIHLVLVPSHLSEDPLRAGLFALDGGAFIAVSVLAFITPHWRGPASLLIVATIVTYVLYVVTGREDLDLVGVFTKVVEAAALAAVMIQRDRCPVSPSPNRTRALIACSQQSGGS